MPPKQVKTINYVTKILDNSYTQISLLLGKSYLYKLVQMWHGSVISEEPPIMACPTRGQILPQTSKLLGLTHLYTCGLTSFVVKW